MEHLLIPTVIIEWQYGDTVVQLVAKTVYGIINYHNIIEVSVLDDSQVLNEDTLLSLNAGISIQTVLY